MKSLREMVAELEEENGPVCSWHEMPGLFLIHFAEVSIQIHKAEILKDELPALRTALNHTITGKILQRK